MTEIYVSNVAFSATERDVKSILEAILGQGVVTSCQIKRNSLDSQHKGYGFITFREKETAANLLCLSSEKDHDFVLQNRRLHFKISKGKSGPKIQSNSIQFPADSLSLGFRVNTTLHVLWTSNLDVSIEYDVQNRRFSFLVNAQKDFRWRQYKLEFTFKYIHEMSTVIPRRGGAALLLELWNPPRVYKWMDRDDKWDEEEDPDLRDLIGIMEALVLPVNGDANQGRWVRTTDFTPCCSIGHSLAYVVEFPKSQTSALKDVLIELQQHEYIKFSPNHKYLTFDTREIVLPAQLLVPLLSPPENLRLPFKLMFKLNYLIQIGNLKRPVLSTEFYRLLSVTPPEQSLWVIQELLNSDETIDNAVPWFRRELDRFEIEAKGFPSSPVIDLAEGLIWVYRILITPTKAYCMGPEVEISNRVTRHYMGQLDNFIRVSFVEEDWESLPPAAVCLTNTTELLSNFQAGRSDIHDRVLRILQEGFSLGGKQYEFLAFSSSQLREQSVWMFAPEPVNPGIKPAKPRVTAESIRAWMGDFLDIRNVAKCAARMGQCFASSTKTLEVYPQEVQHLDDILLRTATNEYCFSDGIGQISKEFANTVAARCGCKGVPSAYQIRYGGYKGVVAVNPKSRHKLSLRPSMRKFDSDHRYLEVIGWTKPLPCYLNRQVITLLSTLGIQDHVFEEMQLNVVSKLNQLLYNGRAAIEFLQATSTGYSHACTLAMLKSGYEPKSEPYLRGLLQAFRASQVGRIRSKARILVPKGRCMMGCLDETGSLAYGEVFVQVSSKNESRYFMGDGLDALNPFSAHNGESTGTHVLTCPMVVAKNPCLHPGDVRVLRGVDIPQLRHMVDCIVFPQRGHRPHPDECSGSDLDGDLYFVTWDPLLIPRGTDTPMNYTPARPIILDRRVTTEDIQEFFVKYMINDSLGLISNSHVVLADGEEELARHPKCLELARLFSVAVDFPKTGAAAVIPRELRPQKYPDFMGKDKRSSYESEKVLGKLYRSLSEETDMRIYKTRFSKEDIANAFDERLRLPGFQDYVGEAWNLKKCYDMKLLSLMDQYGIKTEMEAVSGNICSESRYFVRHQSEVKQRIRMAVSSLQEEARRWFFKGYVGDDGYCLDDAIDLTDREKARKASAWYFVTYNHEYVFRNGIGKGKGKGNSPLISFPWTVFDSVLAIKRFQP